MSIEKILKELTMEIRLLREAILIAEEQAQSPEVKAAQSEPPELAAEVDAILADMPPPKPAAEKPPANVRPIRQPTIDDARVAAMAVTERLGKAATKELLDRFKAARVSEVKDVAGFVAACNDKLAGAA